MKKLFLFAFITISVLCTAQSGYTGSKFSQTYSGLTGTTSINNGVSWSSFQTFTVPIGFTFNFFGNNYTNIFMEGSGFTFFDPSYNYMLHPYVVQLKDASSSASSASPLSYKLEGNSPNRILKIEWKNCEYKNDLGSYANFQLWLFETSNIIEVHIGSVTAANPNSAFSGHTNPGPVIGIFDMSSTPDLALVVNATPPNEVFTQLSTTISSIFNHSMNGIPLNGTVYRFSPASSSNIYEKQAEEQIKIYPNPVSDKIYIRNNTWNYYLIKDVSGKDIASGKNINGIIDVKETKPGVYFLILSTNNNNIVSKHKFIKD